MNAQTSPTPTQESELLKALRELVEACGAVSPFSQGGGGPRFMAAYEAACDLIAKIEKRS